MLRRLTLITWILCCTVTLPARAQEDSPELRACMAQSNGYVSKMLDCDEIEVGKWDKRLNVAYETLLHASKGRVRMQLQREQRAWLHYHLKETHRLATVRGIGWAADETASGFKLHDLSLRTLALEKRVNALR